MLKFHQAALITPRTIIKKKQTINVKIFLIKYPSDKTREYLCELKSQKVKTTKQPPI